MTEQVVGPKPTVGQIWQDCDRRELRGRRFILIESIALLARDPETGAYVEHPIAVCVTCTEDGTPPPPLTVRRTRIRLDRFRPGSTGYRLFRGAPIFPQPGVVVGYADGGLD